MIRMIHQGQFPCDLLLLNKCNDEKVCYSNTKVIKVIKVINKKRALDIYVT